MGVVDQDDHSSQQKVKKDKKKKDKKDKKDKKKKDKADRKEQEGQLEDIPDEEVNQAYDDNRSQYSQAKSHKSGGGNGNPNKLPGLGGEQIGGRRVQSLAPGMDRNDSVGSASKISQVEYADGQPKQNLGSGLILDDSADQEPKQGHQQRVSELSGVPNAQYNEYASNMSADQSNTRMGNSDIGLLNSKIPNQY